MPLEGCVAVIGSLGWLSNVIASELDDRRVVRSEQYGYEDFYSLERIKYWLSILIPDIAHSIGCTSPISDAEVDQTIDWLTLTEEKQSRISVDYAGPHFPIIPLELDSEQKILNYLVDYGRLVRRLQDLFLGVNVKDNNFKGHALEDVIQQTDMPLPSKQIYAPDGTSKQIDASFSVGKRLFIVECRAWPRSIGHEKGQKESIDYIKRKIDKTLEDIDEKAKWLSVHQTGSNYDISSLGFTEIVPVGVSPFVEYIPSLFEWYWLRDDVPRLLTPSELKDELQSTDDSVQYYHGISTTT